MRYRESDISLWLLVLWGAALWLPYWALYAVMVVWLGVSVWMMVRTRQRPQWTTMTLPVVLYLVMAALAIGWSGDRIRALHSWVDLIPLLLPLWVVPMAFDRNAFYRLLYRLLQGYLVVVAMSIVYACLSEAIAPWQWPFFSKELLGGMMPYEYCFVFFYPHTHPTFHCLVACTFLLAGAICWSKGDLRSLDFWGTTMAMVLVPLFSQSRIGWLLWLIVVVAAMVMRWRKWWVIIGFVSVFVLVCTLHSALCTLHSAFYTDPIRTYLYHQAEVYIAHRPWFGGGLGLTWPEVAMVNGDAWTGEHAWYFADPAKYSRWSMPVFQPHNQWLTDWMRGGVGLMFAWSLLGLVWLIDALRRRDYFVAVCAVLLLVVACVDSPLLVARGVCWMAWVMMVGAMARHRQSP